MMEQMRKRVFCLALAAAFLAMLLMNFLTPLEADDYLYMFSFQTGERFTSFSQLVPSAVAHYSNMNGRMVTNLLFAQVMLLAGKTAFNFVNAGVYVLFLLAIYRFIRDGKKYDFTLLMVIQASVFLFAPAFGVTTLWVDGACNYLWGTTLILYALLPFRDALLEKEGRKFGVPKQAGLCLLALMAGNVTENTSLVMIGLMGLCMGWSAIKAKRIPLWMAGMTLMALIGYLLLMGSRHLGVEQGIPWGLYLKRLSLCMDKLLEWRWLFLTYGLLFFLAWRDPGQRRRALVSLALVAGAVIADVAMVLPDYYPQRATFGWVMLLLIACGLLLPALRSIQKEALFQGMAACLALMAVITFLHAMPNVYDRYRQAEARIAHVVAQREAGVMDVVTYGIKSKTPYDIFSDGTILSGNPKYWPNRCFAKYYGIQSVAISQEQN